jgi:hypothetical protein
MKLILFVLATAALSMAQAASSLSSEVQPFRMMEHPATAAYVILPSGGSITVGTGEQPLWQFAQPAQESLGTVARRYREEHKDAPKSKIRMEQ